MRASKTFTLITSIFVCLSFFASGQEAYKRIEIAAPLNPFTPAFENYYLQYEQYVKPNRSWVGTAGYKGDELWGLFYRNGHYSGFRVDVAHRLYRATSLKWLQFFAAGNLNMEAGKFTLRSGFDVPSDSLQMQGVMIGPELNIGAKITILKRVTLTTLVGYRHYFNTFQTESITSNPSYWQPNDWDNLHGNWEANRKYVEEFRKGRYPVVQLNIGYVFGARKKAKSPDIN